MDDTSPATKADISMLKMDIASIIDHFEKRMDMHKEEIIRHFNLVAENLKYDFWGIHKDKIGLLDDRSHNHEERLVVIEKQLAI